MNRGSASSSDAIVQTLAILAIVGGVTKFVCRKSSALALAGPDDASAREIKRQSMVHNEQARLEANFYNTCATTFVSVCGIAPIAALLVWYTQNPGKMVEAVIGVIGVTIFGIIAVAFAGLFRRRANNALASLRATD